MKLTLQLSGDKIMANLGLFWRFYGYFEGSGIIVSSKIGLKLRSRYVATDKKFLGFP